MSKGTILSLVMCITGIYTSFISWSILQERINTKPYATERFKAPLVINVVQSVFAAVVGFVYLCVANKKITNPFAVFHNNNNNNNNSTQLLKQVVVVAILQSVSSPIGIYSLAHIDYLGFLLAKSCKLIPVMVVHIVLYGSSFPVYKYVVAVIVTMGVVVFTMSHNSNSNSNSTTTTTTKQTETETNDGRYLLGMLQLCTSLVFDGLTNSTQDHIFKGNRNVNGANMMCVLNCVGCVMTVVYTVCCTEQLSYTLGFMARHPDVVYNILCFAVFGAVGQVFIFVTLEKFGSLVLVTVTVTRKMLSMVVSVVLFGHWLSAWQWVGVSLVCVGISVESLCSRNSGDSDKKKV